VVFLIVGITFLVQIIPGVNAVLLPLTLQKQGYNNTLIGLCLSAEFVAIVSLSRYLSALIDRLGMANALFLSTMIQAGVLFLLMVSHSLLVWALAIYFYGAAASVFLVALQTWLGVLPLKRIKGLVFGIYGAAISLGFAAGPILLQYTGMEGRMPFYATILISLLAALPFLALRSWIPRIQSHERPRIGFVVRLSPAVFYSAMVGGITFYGIPAFLTIYALMNGMPVKQAPFLLTMFMLGTLALGFLISFLSDFWDRRYVILLCVFVGLLCAVYLTIAIFSYVSALALLFVWGGVQGGIYATGLSLIGERFREEDQVSANVAYTLIESIGGVIGVFLIGAAMDVIGSEGLVYVIVTAATVYFIFALSRYRVV
jgi:MFS family permease